MVTSCSLRGFKGTGDSIGRLKKRKVLTSPQLRKREKEKIHSKVRQVR